MKKNIIIADDFSITGDVPIWNINIDSEGTKKLNRRFKSCVEMYRWLDSKGLLKDNSFEYEPYTRGNKKFVAFAIESSTLIPYRKDMENSGVEDADIACHYMFGDEGFEVHPCLFSGAVQLTWTMLTYRGDCGCIGRSWEIQDVKSLDGRDAYDVQDILQKSGPKAAVIRLWVIWSIYERMCGYVMSKEEFEAADKLICNLKLQAVYKIKQDNGNYVVGPFDNYISLRNFLIEIFENNMPQDALKTGRISKEDFLILETLKNKFN